MRFVAAIDRHDPEQLDRLGAAASSLCAVHCAVCALLPAAFGSLGLGFMLRSEAEWAFTLIAVVLATGAMVVGWRRHRSVLVVGLLAAGISGLLVSRGLEVGSAHHEHSGEAQDARFERSAQPNHGTPSSAEKHAVTEARRDRGSHVAHEGSVHFAGTAVGVLAGLLLVFGHILNIRAPHHCRHGCRP